MKHLINRTLLKADLHDIRSGQNQVLLKLRAVVDLIRSNELITTSNGTMTPHWKSVLRAERVWEYKSLLEIAKLEDQSLRILDCGGASTPLVFYLGQLGCEVHTVDLNNDLVQNTDHVAKHFGWNVYAYQKDMRKFEFPDNYFDRVISVSVIEHIVEDEGKQQAICEMARVLRQGGRLGLTVDFGNVYTKTGHRPLRSLQEVYRLLINPAQQSGLKLFGNKDVVDCGERHFRPSIRTLSLFRKYTFLRLFFEKCFFTSLS